MAGILTTSIWRVKCVCSKNSDDSGEQTSEDGDRRTDKKDKELNFDY